MKIRVNKNNRDNNIDFEHADMSATFTTGRPNTYIRANLNSTQAVLVKLKYGEPE